MNRSPMTVNPLFGVAALCLLAAGTGAAGALSTRVLESYGALPLAFEAQPGRAEGDAAFLARGRGYAVLVRSTDLAITSGGSSVRMRLAGANRAARLTGMQPLPGKASYFVGNDPRQWRTGVPTFAKVQCRSVYPGVDVLYYGCQRQLEHDFLLAPGTDPAVINLEFYGPGNLKLDADGDLWLLSPGGQFRLRKPLVYQRIGEHKRVVTGRYVLRSAKRVGFRVGLYDRSQPLVIDPVLSYSTYLGGSDNENRHANSDFRVAAVAVDAEGSAYVAGNTESANFPVARPFQPANRGSADAFVAKLNPTGSALVWSTYIGGSGLERAFALALDASGNVYVAGRTQSLDFPTVKPAQPGFGGIEDAFVLKLDPSGAALLYSTYLGGIDTDFACGLAVNSSGNAYVSGDTESQNFPVTAGAFQRTYGGGLSDAFVAKLDESGSTFLFSTNLGGSGFDGSQAIAVDSAGNVFVTGVTTSANFPTMNPLQPASRGPQGDAFVMKLSSTGAPVYSTYLGGGNVDAGLAIAVDSSGGAWVAGGTMSPDFPVAAGTPQPSHRGALDGFVAQLKPDGSALTFATFLGGQNEDVVNGMALDPQGNVYLAGTTTSSDFPVAAAPQGSLKGARDAFAAKLHAASGALVHSTYLGGSDLDWGYAIAVDRSGNAYLTGLTASSDFPVVSAAQPAYGGGTYDAFVAKIAEGPAAASLASVSAASLTAGLPLAPEFIASGFGQGLAARTEVAASVPLPTSLAGTTVTVKDSAGVERPAPLFFVSPGQVNYLIPAGATTGAATVTVTAAGQVVATGTIRIEAVAPGLFTANADGRGVAAAVAVKIGTDGSQSSQMIFRSDLPQGSRTSVPIDLGAESDQVVLLLFGTGIRGYRDLAAVVAKIGGLEAQVLGAAAQGQFAGLDQVNVRLPRALAGRGEVDLVLTVEGKTANTVKVNIK